MTQPDAIEENTWLRTGFRLALYASLSLGLGAAAGVLWWRVVKLPAYRVDPGGGASTSERGLAQVISGDAWFCAIGLVVGVGLGLLGWWWFRGLGWSLVLVATVLALTAALVCWDVGHHLGPGPFNPRLAVAEPGDLVPIELTLRAKASIFTWPFFAVVPVLLGSSLGRDDEEPKPLQHGRPAAGG